MTPTVTPVRCERKWVPPGYSVAEILVLVRHHPAAFRQTFPERQVNSLYFDTPALDYFHDHVAGVSERLKVRLRWYGEFDGLVRAPVLELKFKRGSTSWKESCPLPSVRLETVLGEARTRGGWDVPGLPELVRRRLRSLQPTVAGHYRRHYFCSALAGMRLTVDSRLGFVGVTPSCHARRQLLYHGPPLILELKYPEAQADTAAELGAHFPFHVNRCSKYVWGIHHLEA